MTANKKNLTDENEDGFIQNESGNSVGGRGTADVRNEENEQKNPPKKVVAEEGSESDPPLTELDGLKKGGVAPPDAESERNQ